MDSGASAGAGGWWARCTHLKALAALRLNGLINHHCYCVPTADESGPSGLHTSRVACALASAYAYSGDLWCVYDAGRQTDKIFKNQVNDIMTDLQLAMEANSAVLEGPVVSERVVVVEAVPVDTE
eukprot:2089802-Pyramimonas_sp.AAC.1